MQTNALRKAYINANICNNKCIRSYFCKIKSYFMSLHKIKYYFHRIKSYAFVVAFIDTHTYICTYIYYVYAYICSSIFGLCQYICKHICKANLNK